MIVRSNIQAPGHFQNYVNKVSEEDLLKAIRLNTKKFRRFLKDIPRKKIDFAYAEDKWTIKQLLQHIIDAERVFVLRALWFARKDVAAQPGFDENSWGATMNVSGRKWKEMIEEFDDLRASTEKFFASLSEEELLREGISNTSAITPAALGFVVAGHIEHHMDIISEKYLNGNKKEKGIEKGKEKLKGKSKDKTKARVKELKSIRKKEKELTM